MLMTVAVLTGETLYIVLFNAACRSCCHDNRKQGTQREHRDIKLKAMIAYFSCCYLDIRQNSKGK